MYVTLTYAYCSELRWEKEPYAANQDCEVRIVFGVENLHAPAGGWIADCAGEIGELVERYNNMQSGNESKIRYHLTVETMPPLMRDVEVR